MTVFWSEADFHDSQNRGFLKLPDGSYRMRLEDGVEMVELHAPKRFDGATLYCEQMRLGGWEAGGRRGIVGTGQEAALPFDTVITAVGARVDTVLFEAAGLELDEHGHPVLSAMNESSLPGIYVAGDCRSGPATVVAALGDAKKIAVDICLQNGLQPGFAKADAAPVDLDECYNRKGILVPGGRDSADAKRCLACDSLCELCCDVCPNRANVRVKVGGFTNAAQILHVDGLCNECGNCGVFCPRAGNPYKDKMTVFWSEADFRDSQNRGFLKLPDGSYRMRLEDGEELTCTLRDAGVPGKMAEFIAVVTRDYPYCLSTEGN
jgi:putative selenate reductase